MLVTEFAMMDPGPSGNSLLCRCLRAISQFFGFGHSPAETRSVYSSDAQAPRSLPTATPPSRLHIVPAPETSRLSITDHKWRRHQQLLHRPTSMLPQDEREARHHAVRGLYAARAGAVDAAEDCFTQAAACADIDLCEIPGFWQLDRTAMLAAVRAYEVNGRLREASALNARIRVSLRPRVLAPIPDRGSVRYLVLV